MLRLSPEFYEAHLSRMTQDELYALYTFWMSGDAPPDLNGVSVLYEYLDVPEGLQNEDRETANRFRTFVMREDNKDKSQLYREARLNWSEFGKDDKTELALVHFDALQQASPGIIEMPEFVVESYETSEGADNNVRGTFSVRAADRPFGTITLNPNSDIYQDGFHGFMGTLSHEWGHLLQWHQVLRVSDYARQILSEAWKARIPKMKEDDPLYQAAALLSFNWGLRKDKEDDFETFGHRHAHYFQDDKKERLSLHKYREQLMEKHARSFSVEMNISTFSVSFTQAEAGPFLASCKEVLTPPFE